MKLTGSIVTQDYLNVRVFQKVPKIFVGWLAIVLVSQLLISISVGRYIEINAGGLIGLVLCIFNIGIFYIALRVLSHFSVKKYLESCEFYNLGNCEYEILDNDIRFIGSMYSCLIPIKSVRDAQIVHGTGFLRFGESLGFVLPGNNSGNLRVFLDLVNVKIANVKI